MAKRRRKRAKAQIARRRTTVHHNPKRTRHYARRAKAYVGKTIGGIQVMSAARGAIPMLLGALAAKFVAKKFGGEGGAEGDNWTWKHYLTGLLGGFAAAFATAAIFRGKRETAQKVFQGSMLLIGYKWFVNEVAAKNSTLTTYFGADEGLPSIEGYGFGADEGLPSIEGYGQDQYQVGTIYPTDSGEYIKGADGYWRPVDESHRLPGASAGYGGNVRRIDPSMGEVVQRIDPRMGFGDSDWKSKYPS